MSLFGAPASKPGGLFGSSTTTTQPQQSGVLFGSANNTQQQSTGGGLFGQPAQTQNATGGGGLFGGLGGNQNQQSTQQTGGGLFGGLNNNQQSQPQQQQQQTGGGLFGASTQQQGGGLFGASTQQQPQQQGGLFGASTQQPQQQQGFGASILGQSQQNQSGSSLWQPGSGISPRQKSVPEQMAAVMEKWDPSSSSCSFQYYFYNKVDEDKVPFYRPAPKEDERKWEEALSKKPGPGYIPVLCSGFTQLGDRIKAQQQNLARQNYALHACNKSLEAILSNHDLETSIRAMDAKRKHMMLKQRCLTLATKVQVLRNRGYAMGGEEEELKRKLVALDKVVCDPGLGARAEEIWARMVGVRERARLLKEDMARTGAEGGEEGLDEETVKRSEKILEDYARKLQHLKKEIKLIAEDYQQWEKEQGPGR